MAERQAGAASGGSGGPDGPRARTGSWIRFALSFSGLWVGFGLVYYAAVLGNTGYDRFLGLLSQVSAWLLRLLSVDAVARQTYLGTPAFGVTVGRECDAILTCALFASAVLAFPAPLKKRVWGAFLGVLMIQVVNVARIASLVVIGGADASLFELAHVAIWPILLIASGTLFFVLWMRSALEDAAGSAEA